jgi:hypothetical protein
LLALCEAASVGEVGRRFLARCEGYPNSDIDEMADGSTHEWSLRLPGAVQALSVLFILVSLYFGSGAIFAQLGSFFGYIYWIVGIVLIVLLAVSIRMSIANERRATNRSPGN